MTRDVVPADSLEIIESSGLVADKFSLDATGAKTAFEKLQAIYKQGTQVTAEKIDEISEGANDTALQILKKGLTNISQSEVGDDRKAAISQKLLGHFAFVGEGKDLDRGQSAKQALTSWANFENDSDLELSDGEIALFSGALESVIDIDKIPMPKTEEAKKSFLERMEKDAGSAKEELRGFDDSFELSEDYLAKGFSIAVTSDFAEAKTVFNEICAIIDGDKTEEEKSGLITFAQSKTNDSALQLFVAISRVITNPDVLAKLRTEFAFLDSDNPRDSEKSATLILAALKSLMTDESITKDEKNVMVDIFANLFEANFKSLEEKNVDKEDMELESLLSEKDGESIASEDVIAPKDNVKVFPSKNKKIIKNELPSGNASSKVDLDVESGVGAEDLLKNKKTEEEVKKKAEEEAKKKTDASTDSSEEKKKKKTLVEPEKSFWQSTKDTMTEGKNWSKDVATNKIPRAAVSLIVGDAIAVGALATFLPAVAAGPVGLVVAFLIWEMTKSDEKNKAKAPALVVVKDELAEYEKQRKEIESGLSKPTAPTTEVGKAAVVVTSETEVDSGKKNDELGVIGGAVKRANSVNSPPLTAKEEAKSVFEQLKNNGFIDADSKEGVIGPKVVNVTNGGRGV